jgi:hypothetical protein
MGLRRTAVRTAQAQPLPMLHTEGGRWLMPRPAAGAARRQLGNYLIQEFWMMGQAAGGR